MAHFSKKWHIYQKTTHLSEKHLSKNCTFIQKLNIYPKAKHFSRNCTFLQKWHIPPKKAHFSENDIFTRYWHINPKKWHIYPKTEHLSKNRIFIKKKCTFLRVDSFSRILGKKEMKKSHSVLFFPFLTKFIQQDKYRRNFVFLAPT